jgi:Cd2+/Zn2+-exporting ATPase
VIAALLVVTIPLAAGSDRHHHWIYLALVLLVVACPCALVISTPVTTTFGIAQAARSGLLVRGGSHLEALSKVKVLAMDKTGTLTEGHFRVLDVKSTDAATSVQQLLYWCVAE